MSNYRAPIDDIRFQLETFGYPEAMAAMGRFDEFDLDTAMEMLGEFSRFCVAELLPLNGKGDAEGVTFNPEDHSVKTPDGFAEAYAAYCANGFHSLSHAEDHGGMGAPATLAIMASEILIATNKSFSMCPGLTNGLIDALVASGSDEINHRFLEKLVTGEWAGTMALTEPQCGTDLGILTTRAEPYGDHFKLTGNKIWITFGEHDFTENIIHFVLARLPDAPAGIKGISTFVVPKFLEDGTRNPIFCGGLEHKMGIHASPTAVLNLDGAEGWLVGEPHKGMRSMFVMMNAARLNVGIEGLALGEAAYLEALAFSKDRRQSRSLNPARQEAGQEADTILVHPDVRRMLLNIKSTNEGLRGLVAWIAINYDAMQHHPDEAERQKADDLVGLLTPIIKSYGSERGFVNCSEAMQVTAGAGYTRDWPIEQYLRDERIAMIYEGTNHVQALDLVGRKLMIGGGRLLQTFMGEITALIRANKDVPEMAPFVGALKTESKRLTDVTMAMAAKAMSDPEEAAAAASNYLNLFALVALTYVWCRQVEAALALDDSPLRRSKLQTARYFIEMVLPEADAYARLTLVGKAPTMDFDVDLL